VLFLAAFLRRVRQTRAQSRAAEVQGAV